MLSEPVRQEIEQSIITALPTAFVVEMDLHQGAQSLLTIKVDTDAGITMRECERISRHLNLWLDEQDYFDFAYRLEVSSPGIGAPLRLIRQYKQNVGRFLSINKTDGSAVKAKLEGADEEAIEIRVMKPNKGKNKAIKHKLAAESTSLTYAEIQEAKVILV